MAYILAPLTAILVTSILSVINNPIKFSLNKIIIVKIINPKVIDTTEDNFKISLILVYSFAP